ncbi:MAG: OmpA family protein, partial [Bacteroidota bacterium]|nr:OmpA family protein [Bacteroidota bacterium]
GVPDYLDKCPNTPAGAAVDKNGCPIDSDNDGVPDYKDKCPDTPAGVAVDQNGCPIDSDNDGVPDYLDKCPDTPAGAEVDKDGCPIVKVEPKVLEVVSEPVYFKINLYDIRKAERVKADNAVKYLKAHPNAKIIISGHADKTGPNAFNLKLSKQRAQVVYKYLLSKKVKKSSIAGVTSYGSSKPAVEGDSPEALSKNRRTEFELQK